MPFMIQNKKNLKGIYNKELDINFYHLNANMRCSAGWHSDELTY